MKKRNLGVLALSSVLAFGAVGLTLTTLAGCGQQASFGELTVEAVGDQEYGATVDLKPLVRFDGKADETKTKQLQLQSLQQQHFKKLVVILVLQLE